MNLLIDRTNSFEFDGCFLGYERMLGVLKSYFFIFLGVCTFLSMGCSAGEMDNQLLKIQRVLFSR